MRLADLRAEHIEHMLRRIKADHPKMGPSSRRGVFAVLRSAMTRAIERKMIAVNPWMAVDRDVLSPADRPEVKPWQPEELADFLDHEAVRVHRMRPL